MTRRHSCLAVGVLAVALAACDPFGPLGVLTDDQRLESIVFTPDSSDLRVGDSVKVAFKLVGKGGGNLTSGTVTFTAGNPILISVSSAGYVKGLRVGRTEVLGTMSGKRGVAVINVVP